MAVEYQPLAAAVIIKAGVNDSLDFKEGGIAATATIAPGTYYFFGVGTVSDDLSTALKAAIEATSPGVRIYTVLAAYNIFISNFPCISGMGITVGAPTTFQIMGTSTFDIEILGHPGGVDTAGSISLQSTIGCSHSWVSNQPAAIVDAGPYSRNVIEHVTPEGGAYHFAAGDNLDFRNLSFEFVDKDRTFSGSTPENKSFEEFWKIANDGRKIRVFQQVASTFSGAVTILGSSASLGDYTMTGGGLTDFAPARPVAGLPAYAWPLPLRKVQP